MTAAPLSSTIVSIGLIPVAFFFIHAYYSGRKHQRIHPVTGAIAIGWDLTLSIGYMLYRTFGGAVEGASIEYTPAVTAFFGIHGAIAVVVMVLEIAVLAIGVMMVKRKTGSKWHGKLTKILFPVWWLAFLSGEIVYIALYLL